MEDPPLIHPDIRKAQTLPSRYYTESTVFDDLKSKLSKSFHYAAHISQLEENNIIPLPQLENILNESLILVKSDEVICLSNVCTHRGMLIATESCSSKSLKCGYHGRTFGLDGCMKNMPEFDDVENFPSEKDNLKEFQVHQWKGLFFVGGDRYFSSVINELERRIGWLKLEKFTHDESRYRDYEIKANWALYIDNYLEGFHIPFVHSDLNAVLDYGDYTTELFEGGVLQIGIASEGEPFFEIPEGSPDYGKKIAAYYWWLFPGLMLNIYPWGVSVNIVVPEAVDKTRVIYQGYVTDPEMLGQGAGGNLDKVEIEDQFVVEGCLRGIRSSAYDRGRYSPEMERGVHHFHRMLTRE